MVGRLTIGKKKYAQVQGEMEALVASAEDLRGELTVLIQKDTDVFNGVMHAYRMPKENEKQKVERAAAVQDATYQAALIPLDTCGKALQVLRLALSVAEKGNLNAITDAGSAAALAAAAIASAGANVRINLSSLVDNKKNDSLTAQLEEIESEVRTLKEKIRSILESRANLAML